MKKNIPSQKILTKTSERVIPENFKSKEDYLIFLKHLLAYEFAKNKISKKGIVLEVGSGEGYGTSLLSKKVKKIIGLDVDKKIVIHSSEKYGSENCIFKDYNGYKLPFNKKTFDAVVSFQVIEHIQDDKNYVSEIFRVLKKSGIFILTTPNRKYRLKDGQKPWNRLHIREYNAKTFETILKSKFQNVKVLGVKGDDIAQKIETGRVKRLSRLVALDPLDLRRYIPTKIKNRAIKAIKLLSKSKKNNEVENDYLNNYSLKNFFIIKENLNESLDLLGVCEK